LILFIKIALILTLAVIAFQDIKDHLIWWFLPILFAMLGGYLQYVNTIEGAFVYLIALNFIFLIGVVASLWLVASIVKKSQKFSRKGFGLGDLLMMIALAVSFPFIHFLLFALGAFIFSIIANVVISSQKKGIPLAGYMSVFLIIVYACGWGYDESILYL
jgi:hypothetical protein